MEKNPGHYGIAALAIAALLSAGACDRADNTATGLSEGGSERSAQVSPESAPSEPTASTAPGTSSAETAPGPMAGADSAAGQDAGSGTPGISGYTGPAEGRTGAEGGTGTAPSGASSSAGGSATTSGPGAAERSAGKALSSTDRNFVRETARDNMFEIEVARLAAERANDPQVKSFAAKLVDDHTKASEQLQQIARSHNVKLPSDLQAADKRKVERLRSATGTEFDKQFLQMVGVKGHQQEIKDFERASSRARDADVREFARSTLPALREHLSTAQQLAATVGTGATTPPQGYTGEEAGTMEGGAEQQPVPPAGTSVPGTGPEGMGTTTSPQGFTGEESPSTTTTPQGYTGQEESPTSGQQQ